MNNYIIFIFSYIAVVFIDISIVMYFHNKYGYIQYYKNSLYRQLMYLVVFSTILYTMMPKAYLATFYNLNLILAVAQFLLYFQIVFEGIHDFKIQSICTITAILFMGFANATGLNILLRILFIVISLIAIGYYLRRYEFMGIDTLIIFLIVWGAFGMNQYVYLTIPTFFISYWIVLISTTWLTQSFLSSFHTKTNSGFVNVSSRNLKVNSSELKDKILEVAPVSLILTDHTSKILYVNKSVEKMTGYSASELIDAKTQIFKSGETQVSTYKDMWQTIKSGKQWNGTLRNKRKDGEVYWEDVTIIPIINNNNIITNYLGVKFDSSKAIVERSILENNAYFDDLTGTLRRRRFNELMNETMQSRRNGPFYVVMIDVDKFKTINDTFGHAKGDQVLTRISNEISQVFSNKNSFVSRIGGDEFAIFTYGVDKKSVYHGAETIRETVTRINLLPEFKDIEVSVSIGISKVTRGLELALKKADTIMYSNKLKPRNGTIKK